MNIRDLLESPKLVVIFVVATFCVMAFSLMAVLVSLVNQSSILLST